MKLDRKEIQQRKKELNTIVDEYSCDKYTSVEGKIRAITHGNGYQYYLSDNTTDHNGKYVKKQEQDKVVQLVEKEYAEKVLERSYKELKLIDKLYNLYEKGTFEDIYAKMPKGKQKLISPIVEPEEEFLAKYMSMEYTQPAFKKDSPEFYSDRNERVRSKSELLIANKLLKMNIPYRYEMPLDLNIVNAWGEKILIHPDFTIIDVKRRRLIYWEHLGKLDDKDYVNKTIRKIRSYEKNGIYLGESLIITGESSALPLDIKLLDKEIARIAEMLAE